MFIARFSAVLAAVLLLACQSASAATPKVFVNDEWSADFSQATAAINGQSVNAQPGFVQGEAFGAVFKPTAVEYPVEILGIQLILASPASGAGVPANAVIEIYNSPSQTADPGVAPMFSISTSDLFNPQTQSIGFPLAGNYGITIQFDLQEPGGHPDFIMDGNIWVVVRFADAASDGISTWGRLECLYFPELGGCGCQTVAPIHDAHVTPHANVLHIVTPVGQCSGSKQWTWFEDVPHDPTFTIGDFMLRLMTNVAKPPCVASCTDAVCGDDGCGGVCGPGCEEGLSCYQGDCVRCVPSCISKQCGDDGCGGTCGNCTGQKVCEDFFCVVPCDGDCTDAECGDDGCGGSCGTCGSGETCSEGACTSPCVPDCAGRRCGTDGCGGLCGPGCGASQTCNSGQCVTPCTSDCAGKECGDDGCGGTCGSCGSGELCDTAGLCALTCTPQCDGRVCGDNGCGASCGVCAAGTQCAEGACVGLTIDDVSPDGGSNDKATAVAITGSGFADGASALIGGTALFDVSVKSATLITASVPAGLEPDTYSVIVTNPGGATVSLRNAFQVRAPTTVASSKSGGCDAQGGSGALPVALALASLLLVALRRSTRRDGAGIHRSR